VSTYFSTQPSFADCRPRVTCLIIAPVFFSAANYVLLGRIIKATGNRWTSITSVSFATIFVTGDIVCLSIQGAGGGIAGSAITDANANKGAYIMTGGVITQLVVTLCFVVVWAEFIYRYYLNKPVNKQYDFIATLPNWMVPRPMRSSNTGAIGEKKRSNSLSPTSSDVESAGVHRSTSVEVSPGKVTLYLTVLAATTLLIVVRSVYRSIELLGGWNGSIETNQNLFIALDASLMLVVLVIYSVFPPGMFDGTRFF